MNTPNELRYTRSDEWVRIEGDIATIGITDYAQIGTWAISCFWNCRNLDATCRWTRASV